ncbi:MAG: hypothetical protein M9894_12555 [Planctomycetes bacterium]|nr:hypothetical protein [Planctomycetota bacterium]
MTPRYVIKRIALTHCKRGPASCARCREVARERVCLLDTLPRAHPEAARPMIAVREGDVTVWRTYDVVGEFASVEEARERARATGIADEVVDLTDPP